jgi:hypothetical protein
MKIIFDKTLSGDLVVYVHCTAAADQHKFEKKLFTHSEYMSEWDAKLDEWLQKEYYKHYLQETLVGRETVITTLTFINGRNDDLIKELSSYLEESKLYGYYLIEYNSFTN